MKWIRVPRLLVRGGPGVADFLAACLGGPREAVVAIRPLGGDEPTFVARQATREFQEGGQIDREPFEATVEEARRMAEAEFFVRLVRRGAGRVGVFHCRADGGAFAASPDAVCAARRGAPLGGVFESTEEAVREGARA